MVSKLEDGNYRGALRLACGSDIKAEHSHATLQSLKKKHFTSHPDRSFIPVPNANMFSVFISAEAVRRTVISFLNGSAGGPDGLSPHHLEDHTGPSANEGGEIFLNAITSLVTLILKGKTPNQICPCFWGHLGSTHKKDFGCLATRHWMQFVEAGCNVCQCTCPERSSKFASPKPTGFWDHSGSGGSSPCYLSVPAQSPVRPSHREGGL